MQNFDSMGAGRVNPLLSQRQPNYWQNMYDSREKQLQQYQNPQNNQWQNPWQPTYPPAYPQNNQWQNPQPQPQQAQTPGRDTRVIYVGNVKEAEAYLPEPMTTYFFIDEGAGKIYMKELDRNTGLSKFHSFIGEDPNEGQPQQAAQGAAVGSNGTLDEINRRLSNIEKTINYFGGLINVQSVSGGATGGRDAGQRPADDEKPDGGDA